MATSCSSDWDDHYDEAGITLADGSSVVIYNGSITDYIGGTNDLSKMNALFKRNGIFTTTRADGQYTFIVCTDAQYDESKVTDEKAFAEQCVADMAVNPAKLTDGSNINTRSGKSVWVYDGGKKLDDYTITKVVKAANGYIYYVDGTIPVRQSAYELLLSLGDEYSVMRTQLTTSMLTVLATNISRKIIGGRFFEISKRFIAKSLPVTEQPDELATMSVGIYGKDEDFFTLKGIIESIMKLCGAHTEYERSAEPYLHPGRQALVKSNNVPAAVFGEVHPAVAAQYGIDSRVYVAEIKLDILLGINKRKTVYKPLPKFPAVERDFAMLCDSDLPVGTLEKAIAKGAGRLLEKIELFDVYSGAQIPEGKKSVAYSVWLRSADATLTDTEIEAASSSIIKNLESVGAELRK